MMEMEGGVGFPGHRVKKKLEFQWKKQQVNGNV